ncbi:MAG: ribonuclease III [Eggerthellaceae bacterium]|jgi:ribonuclease-3
MDQTDNASDTERLEKAQREIGYQFKDVDLLRKALTHPSAVETQTTERSYERLEFLGDSVLGVIVAQAAFDKFPDLDEGGLTRIKVALVAGSTLSEVAQELGFAEVILFGSSEVGTGRRGMHSALENVYEAVVAALYLDGGYEAARDFIGRTLLPRMTIDYAQRPENPKSALQERLQEEGITPTYQLVETQGPPHDRTFVSAVFAGVQSLARGVGRTKKEAESQAADTALRNIRKQDEESKKDANAAKKEAKKRRKAAQKAEKRRQKSERAAEKEAKKAHKNATSNAGDDFGRPMGNPPEDPRK